MQCKVVYVCNVRCLRCSVAKLNDDNGVVIKQKACQSTIYLLQNLGTAKMTCELSKFISVNWSYFLHIPDRDWKMRFVHRGLCAENRVPVGTTSVEKKTRWIKQHFHSPRLGRPHAVKAKHFILH